MDKTKQMKHAMKLHGVTYADMGRELNRSPYTVKQRLNTKSTFHKHLDEYTEALKRCIELKEKEKEKALEKLG